MLMVTGGTRPIMARYGIPRWTRDGRPIATDIGPGSSLGDGVGSIRRPGALRRLIMAAGPMWVAVGVGYLDLSRSYPAEPRWPLSTRQRWSLSSAAVAGALRCLLAVLPWAGLRWDRERSMCPLIK